MWLIGGAGWLLLGLSFGFFLMKYFSQGAGVQFMSITSGGVLLSMVHVIGIFLASGFCFVLAIGWWAHGLVPHDDPAQSDERPDKLP